MATLALCINLSMINKTWKEVHPEHLYIILDATKDGYIEGTFKKLVLEILAETKII